MVLVNDASDRFCLSVILGAWITSGAEQVRDVVVVDDQICLQALD